MSRELNESQNASVGMTVGMIEVRFGCQRWTTSEKKMKKKTVDDELPV